ncbi:hypothetical protein NEOLEDRAFT_741179 [Neolentinus lepideus HHB14362 ss-1]|uniref:Chitin synthase export chaperone n=1 Tax=Neolentinus lepideus HHB14362 ss-1 TaxID=1314782 RepID=A0A165PVX6_9AGAM|nr:hypothetical protein NEOLEDRAFT_741179 [Neolentinus lepideus HHB14362 ss-1]
MMLLGIILSFLASTAGVHADDGSIDTLVDRVLSEQSCGSVAGILYLISGIMLLNRLRTYRDRWGLCLPVGVLSMSVCFWLRLVDTIKSQENSIAMYTLQYLFVICAPAAFLAFTHILYVCVIMSSVIRHERVARIFVISDISTFLFKIRRSQLIAQLFPLENR